jgi:2-polyprenyl-3-methyl-5-hydroxy-6-metoxy-1,4-benzoquinol methylase
MKNLTREVPQEKLDKRLYQSMKYVTDADVKDKVILDIGCGYGWCELNFLKRGAKKVVGIEITEEDLKTVKKNIKDKRAEFKVGDATNLKFPKESFDTIVCWEVLEHIPLKTEHQMFAQIHKVLKPGGILYLSTPYNDFLSTIMDPAWWVVRHRHYSKDDIKEYAKKNSFELVDIHVRGGRWVSAELLNMYIAKWIFRREPFFKDTFSKHVEKEYKQKNGTFDIFAKLKKV